MLVTKVAVGIVVPAATVFGEQRRRKFQAFSGFNGLVQRYLEVVTLITNQDAWQIRAHAVHATQHKLLLLWQLLVSELASGGGFHGYAVGNALFVAKRGQQGNELCCACRRYDVGHGLPGVLLLVGSAIFVVAVEGAAVTKAGTQFQRRVQSGGVLLLALEAVERVVTTQLDNLVIFVE